MPRLFTNLSTVWEHIGFALEALSDLLANAQPAASIEFNAADLPIGVEAEPAPTGISIGEAIRSIDATRSRACSPPI